MTINGVKSIGVGAFYACTSLKKVRLGAGVGDAVDSMEFQGCSALETIEVDSASEIYEVYKGALYEKGNSVNPAKFIMYPQNREGDTLTIMEDAIFEPFSMKGCGNTNLKNVVLESETVYKVVDGVVFDQDMKTLYYYPAGKTDVSYTIPSGVEHIKDYAFYNAII